MFSALLGKMEGKGLAVTAVSFNAAISGYCNEGELNVAFHFVDEMVRKGIEPSTTTYNLLVLALFMEGRDVEANALIKDMG
ncbi:Pentatricopeptide repeat-containing protein [Dendrobium catenatum]|uniref:Pentatricopeptide repeat-containing protein n=1 Tax=Dendrobium catenatum TaxID=906689 RepID=A0A2I0X573_9ASPA|nr:Pentatricopeptide repeat-containing protein [Dendrobium catenatum]